MALGRLQVTDFRCLQAAELDLDPHFTLISGPNASGKTSLLEAIYVLGRGRSFRTRRLEHLIRRDAAGFVVYGEVHTPERRIALGVEGLPTGIRGRINGVPLSSLTELALNLPVQIIDPEVHKLIEEGPGRRRRYLDWGVFHVEPGFVRQWQRYHQVLKQRNAALKAGQSRSLVGVWDAELIQYGEHLTASRARYVDMLSEQIQSLGFNLLGQQLALSYRAGWSRDLSFAGALSESWAKDIERGATQVGPHRAELSFRLDGLSVKDRISRGQQKLLAAALLIAQLKLFPADAPIRPSLLLDDPAAELDNERLASLIREVSAQAVQLIVTTLHGEFSAFGTPGRRFGISAGKVSPI
jgi:DNA replication and repair protein RecF